MYAPTWWIKIRVARKLIYYVYFSLFQYFMYIYFSLFVKHIFFLLCSSACFMDVCNQFDKHDDRSWSNRRAPKYGIIMKFYLSFRKKESALLRSSPNLAINPCHLRISYPSNITTMWSPIQIIWKSEEENRF